MRSIFLILLVVVLPAMAQEPDSSSALFKMRDAERHFAQNSVMHGRNAAFVESFAGESVIFTDKWITSGKQFWPGMRGFRIMDTFRLSTEIP